MIYGPGPRLFSAWVKVTCSIWTFPFNTTLLSPVTAEPGLISALYVERVHGVSLPYFQNFSSFKRIEIQPQLFPFISCLLEEGLLGKAGHGFYRNQAAGTAGPLASVLGSWTYWIQNHPHHSLLHPSGLVYLVSVSTIQEAAQKNPEVGPPPNGLSNLATSVGSFHYIREMSITHPGLLCYRGFPQSPRMRGRLVHHWQPFPHPHISIPCLVPVKHGLLKQGKFPSLLQRFLSGPPSPVHNLLLWVPSYCRLDPPATGKGRLISLRAVTWRQDVACLLIASGSDAFTLPKKVPNGVSTNHSSQNALLLATHTFIHPAAPTGWGLNLHCLKNPDHPPWLELDSIPHHTPGTPHPNIIWTVSLATVLTPFWNIMQYAYCSSFHFYCPLSESWLIWD